MLWIKSFHLVFMVSWFAGLFYLPRLFVYHADCKHDQTSSLLKIMESRLYYWIMTPAAILTLVTGIWMLISYAWASYRQDTWLHLKLLFVAVIITYHIFCGYWLHCFRVDKNVHGSRFFRWINELPLLLLIGVIVLVIVKPHF